MAKLKYRRLVFVAGASGEVGAATVRRLVAQDNVYVVGLSRRFVDLDAPNYRHVQLDLEDADGVSGLIRIIDEIEHVSVSWVHCVGHFKSYDSLRNTDISELSGYLNGNALTLFHSVKIWVDMVSRTLSGNFVLFSAFSVEHGYPFMAAFNGAKAACESLVKSVSNEILAEDVTINCLRVSTIDTPIERMLKSQGDIENWLTPDEAADIGVRIALDHTTPRVRGGIIPIYKPSTSFHGQSIIRRFGKTEKDFL